MDSSSTMWSGNIDPNLALPSHEDFQFLDMDMGMGMQFDFQNAFDSNHLMLRDHTDSMDIHMHDESDQLGHLDTTMQEPTNGSSHSTLSNTAVVHGHTSTEELDAQIQYLQQQRKHMQERQLQDQQRNFYVGNNMIPSTPNSFKMHPKLQTCYPQTDQHIMYNQFHQWMKEQEMAITPLVSPAVTPLETQFNLPDYTPSGACFSPLSSPALHVQIESRAVFGAQCPGTSHTASPVDINTDSNQAPASAASIARKAARKTVTKPRTTRAVRQFSIVKPQRKKTGSTVISSQALADILKPNLPQEGAPKSSSAASTEASENGSISPEHLSDMAPPLLPHFTKASPNLTAQNAMESQQQTHRGDLSPATPASLMRITKSPHQPIQVSSPLTTPVQESDLNALDKFSLRGPAKRSKPPCLDTQSDGQTIPTVESDVIQGMGFQRLPSPVFARPAVPKSTTQSPQINGVSANGPTASRFFTSQSSAARNMKKRSSTSSVHVSPALRPRISPSIKPLLSGSFNGGVVNEETVSLLLASKSNYQNILEGTVLEGVQYPKELERGLTSKRTSHKIAEQGRRNRINSALQEIATLLPKRTTAKDSGGEKSDNGEAAEKDREGNLSGEKKGGGQSANSKASTVELAIDYIKTLRNDLAEANKRAEEAERKLQQMVGAEETVTDNATPENASTDKIVFGREDVMASCNFSASTIIHTSSASLPSETD